MSDVLIAQLAATSAYAGFQWTVRAVVYPQLANVPGPAFVAYLAAYQRRVTHLVIPLFAALLVTTALVAVRPDINAGARVLGVTLLAVVLGTTALSAVPAHRRLSEGWDVGAHQRLLRADTVRVVAATMQAALSLTLLALSP